MKYFPFCLNFSKTKTYNKLCIGSWRSLINVSYFFIFYETAPGHLTLLREIIKKEQERKTEKERKKKKGRKAERERKTE